MQTRGQQEPELQASRPFWEDDRDVCPSKRVPPVLGCMSFCAFVVTLALVITAYVQVTEFAVGTIGVTDPQSGTSTWSGPDAVTYHFDPACDTPEHSALVMGKFVTPSVKSERLGVNQTKLFDVVPVTKFDAGCRFSMLRTFQSFFVAREGFPGERDWTGYAIAAVSVGGAGFLIMAVGMYCVAPGTKQNRLCRPHMPHPLWVLFWHMLVVILASVALAMYAHETRPVTQCFPILLDSFDPWLVHLARDSRGALVARNAIWLILDGIFSILKTPAEREWMTAARQQWHCANVEIDLFSTWTPDPVARILIAPSAPVRTRIRDFVGVTLARYNIVACGLAFFNVCLAMKWWLLPALERPQEPETADRPKKEEAPLAATEDKEERSIQLASLLDAGASASASTSPRADTNAGAGAGVATGYDLQYPLLTTSGPTTRYSQLPHHLYEVYDPATATAIVVA